MDFNFTNGGSPCRKLIQSSNGLIYGMTQQGGINDSGVIYSLNPTNNAYSILYNFNVAGSYLRYSGLLELNNKLYGMNQDGGINNIGTIFSFDLGNNTYTELFAFDGVSGSQPYGTLIKATNGKLYGMTAEGGINSNGVLFSFDPANNIFTDLLDFDSTLSYNPYGDLLQAGNGNLYGLVYGGGAGGYGILFSYNFGNNMFTDLYDFNSVTGVSPGGSLIQASDVRLYGTTIIGGANNYGVIFRFDPATNIYTDITDLNFPDGTYPYGDLIEDNMVGISEPASNSPQFTISANPTTDVLIIKGKNPAMNTYKIKITNTTGQIVSEKEFIEQNSEIPLSIKELPVGIYFLNIYSDRINEIFKIVKQ